MTSLVNTKILSIDPHNPQREVIALAAELLQNGRLVAFPTETVYGLGANALDPAAVSRIFEAKNRPYSDPLIVHIEHIQQIHQVAIHVPEIAWELAEKFWPGPLTLILERNPAIPANVSAGGNTVAVRMPDHRVPRQLIHASGKPIAAPSANLFTRPSPTTAEHVYADLKNRVDLILDGGPCAIGLESTVLNLLEDIPAVLRPGGTTFEALQQVVPNIRFVPRYLSMESHEAPSASPGMLSKHYAPQARLFLFTGSSANSIEKMIDHSLTLGASGARVGIMMASEDQIFFEGVPADIELLGSQDDLMQISQNLFAAMRALEQRKVDVILVRDYGVQGLGLAIWDRLVRASDGSVINA